MLVESKLDSWHLWARHILWLRYFTVFCRIGLAWGFLPSGYVKIAGERFTSLSSLHPMGSYLEALHHTGYCYTFIGIAQMTAAVLLLIPRTATLGALLYFPIILNICLLSLAVCFEGSLLSSPMMVLANLYLLCWDYDKLKPIFRRSTIGTTIIKPVDNRFPFRFFAGVVVTVVVVATVILNSYSIKPRNTTADCNLQCDGDPNCSSFCDCIHSEGKTYDDCAAEYKQSQSKK